MLLNEVFNENIIVKNNLIYSTKEIYENRENQKQVKESYTFQWDWVNSLKDKKKAHENQKKWYLQLYGFNNENELKEFLKNKKVIFDAGCGLGYKAAWFAELSPNSIVIAMDYSDSVYIAANNYKGISNLYFIQGDIANTAIKEDSIDYINCDQVIMHTEDPDYTFKHLSTILKIGGNLHVMYIEKRHYQGS